ncbi:MAG: hypothetical protein GVY08_15555 [Bacteroidetes bacterium]|jgi:hypothetical protein|nr:hypothetical protein [Bacteroidota bacterium]
MKLIQIFAPIDLGDSWLHDNDWEQLEDGLENFGWYNYDFSKKLQLDLSFFQYYQWMKKDIEDVNSIKLADLKPECNGVESVQEGSLLMCNTGIILLYVTYELDETIKPALALQVYNDLSKTHFENLFKEVLGVFKQTELPELPNRIDDMFSRNLIYSKKDVPHWTHGIFLHQDAENNLYQSDQLQDFSLADTYYEYRVGDDYTRCSIGWEMTAISTSGSIEEKGLVRLIWIVGFLWEEMYVFEKLTILKVNHLEKGIKNIRSKLAQARRFRTVVTTVIASAAPASLTMVDRYIRILEIIMDQWRINERKESLTGKIGLLELMYSNMKDEESEYNASIFNLYVLLLTILNGIASGGVIIEYITGSNSFNTFYHLLWAGSMVAFLLLLYGYSKYYEKKNFH